jgi:predicted enzyme involved in methoxymalonyl-ACP biosynthesis/formylglycine-generating enzyme required for sulfatase activity
VSTTTFSYIDRLKLLENAGGPVPADAEMPGDLPRLRVTFEGPHLEMHDLPVLRESLASVGRLLGVALADAPGSTTPEVVVFPTYLLPEAERLYLADAAEAGQLGKEALSAWHQAVTKTVQAILGRLGPDGLVLVHDLPEPLIPPAGIQDLVQEAGLQERIWEANLALVREIRKLEGGRARVVPVHRALGPDLLAICAMPTFSDLMDRLTRVGRQSQASHFWHALLALAWLHWHWLLPVALPARKLLAIDLDETIWSGTLAEEGQAGVASGWRPPTVTFALLQARLRALAGQGTILAAVSRNDPVEAEQTLAQHAPGLRLAGTKISRTINKTNAILELCQQFGGIASDAAVFIDDNPVERAVLTQELPAVITPPFASPPALIDDLFLHIPHLERLRILPEDTQRNQFLAAQRTGTASGRPPQVHGLVNPQEPAVLARVADLHQKTNQFNMTTPRMKLGELEHLTRREDAFLIAFEVEIPESGLKPEIAGCAEVCRSGPTQWTIASFLMSCRYMGGGTGRRMLAALIDEVARRGGALLLAHYRRTDRNTAFREWYPACGFRRRDDQQDGGAVTFEGHLGRIRSRLTADQGEEVERYLARHVRLAGHPAAVPPRIREADGSTEVFVCGATFTPGLTPEAAEAVGRIFGMEPVGEIGRSEVRLPSFWMDRTCIAQKQFCRFLDEEIAEPERRRRAIADLCGYEGDCQIEFDDAAGQSCPRAGTERRPAVVPIEWAERYARWAGARLPTEDEWEWAARGPDGRWFPWGNEIPDGFRLCYRNPTTPCDTGNFEDGKSPFGLVGMTGNVWQWCAGEYLGHAPYRGGDHKVDSLYLLRVTVRPLEAAKDCGHSVGFRLVRDAS